MDSQAKVILNVLPGQFRVSSSTTEVFYCLLGSCVATCLFDPVACIGGINHFLLPGSNPSKTESAKYGAQSMAKLVNAMLRQGAVSNRLHARIYGGAQIIETSTSIGHSNAQFAQDFIQRQGFFTTDVKVGGATGRRVLFAPAFGSATVNEIGVREVSMQNRCRNQTPPN